jgi:2-keto-4-pentenoate hydratase/2-oxohepta-3-ene-1,7-dioic acid hydratase in catechol pathway
MRFANVEGRAAAVSGDRYVDLETVTNGAVPADPMAALEALGTLGPIAIPDGTTVLDPARLGPPVPRPQKILGAGINYHSHAEEANIPVPGAPSLFAKLPSALCGAYDDIRLRPGRTSVDWEAELVVVIGSGGKDIAEADAWAHVAGVTAGQDISDREEQFRDLAQFTIGKSFDTFAPIGPVLVTTDELTDRDDIGVTCVLNGEEVQRGRTSECIFSVAELISWISRACTLEVGDLIFTGTPPGVGYTRTPARFLGDGDVLETIIEGVGSMRNVCRNGVAAA